MRSRPLRRSFPHKRRQLHHKFFNILTKMKLIENYLDKEKAMEIWKEAKDIYYCQMLHRSSPVPRLISVQGKVDQEEWVPIYRHPVDVLVPLKEWKGCVKELADRLSAHFQQDFNHVLIQYYRTGNDYISEHSDKTIDLVKDSAIVNFSVGTSRLMVLRGKQVNPGEQRESHKYVLPHNSLFVLSQEDNRVWLHQIKKDANLSIKDEFGGERISFTFRSISTFIHPAKMLIYGSGSTSKFRNSPAKIDNSTAQELLHAFSAENKTTDFNWELYYGKGFDCVDCLP
jgi:alkylated DNA repair dioxygenase AlkB